MKQVKPYLDSLRSASTQPFAHRVAGMILPYADLPVKVSLWRFSSQIFKLYLVITCAATLNAYAKPSDPILLKAQVLVDSGKADSAHSIYARYLKENPRSVDARLGLSRIAERNFDYPLARKYLEEALAIDPNRGDAMATLGHLFFRWSVTPVGEPALYMERAREFLTQAQTIAPNDPTVLAYVAEYQLEHQELVVAERNLQAAMRLSPTHMPTNQGLIRFYIQVRDLARAKDAALRAVELDPQDSENYYLIARLMLLADHPAEAVKYAERSEQVDFGHLPDRDALLAESLEKLGELERAIGYYDRLVGYAPAYATGWFKLGQLYERTGKAEQSAQAYRKAVALQPELLDNLITQAADSTRSENAATALPQWRRILEIEPGNEQALGAIAGLHYLNWLSQNNRSIEEVAADRGRFSANLPNNPSARLQLDQLKLEIAMRGTGAAPSGAPEDLDARLKGFAEADQEPFATGEALFLRKDYVGSQQKLDEVDGLEAREYLVLADRLLLDQELVSATIFYQRAYELEPMTAVQQGLKRIQAKKALAEQRLQEGNTLFTSKLYSQALTKYEEARRIYPQWETVYLRLGDTHQQLRQWPAAYQAFHQAIALNPGLMDSKGFAKNYRRLEKQATAKH